MTVWEKLTGVPDTPADRREDFAGRLAQGLLNIFALTLVISYALMGCLLAGAIYRPSSTLAAVVPTIKDALEIIRLSGSLFSPLLAFVLGYYFNQSTHLAAQAAGAKAGAEAGAAAGGEKGAATGAEAGANIVNQSIAQATVSDTDTARAAGAAAGASAGSDAGRDAGEAAGATFRETGGGTAPATATLDDGREPKA